MSNVSIVVAVKSCRSWLGAALLVAASAMSPAQAATVTVPVFDISASAKYKDVAQPPKVAWVGDHEFVAVWGQLSPGSTDADGRWDLMMRRFNDSGAPLTGEIRIANAHQLFAFDASMAIRAVDAGHYVVAWVDSDTSTGAGFDLYGQVFNLDGSAASLRFPIDTVFDDNQVFPSIIPGPSGQFAVIYRSTDATSDGADIYAQRFSMAGRPVGSDVRINTVTSGLQSRPAADCDLKGHCLVVWNSSASADGSTPFEIKGQYVTPSLNMIGSEFLISNDLPDSSSIPAVGMDGAQNAVVGWITFNSSTQHSNRVEFARYRPNHSFKNGNTLTADGVEPDSTAFVGIMPTGEHGFFYSMENKTRSQLFVKDYTATGAIVSTSKLADVAKTSTLFVGSSIAVNAAGRAVVTWQEYPASGSDTASYFRGAILQGFGTP
ncbi:MAG TPA: hypothetical protein VHE37_02960 [Nevskiaceae bacterium]|nr:hypothetical protein [Nevskiaceae bacterium]